MIVKIVTCPRCFRKTLIITATNSSVTKKCSECDYNEVKLLNEFK